MNWCIRRSTYENISVFKIIPPVWSDFPLSTNVPYIQFKTLWLYTFDVKTLKQKISSFTRLWDQFLTKLHLPAMLFINSEVLCQMWHRWYWKQFDREQKCIYTCFCHSGWGQCWWCHAECTHTWNCWGWLGMRTALVINTDPHPPHESSAWWNLTGHYM